MRDENRIKEKLELSLDTRQIASVLIAGVVILGAVFVLGVVTGKSVSSAPAETPPPQMLTALDAQDEKLKPVENTSTLTFQEELTKSSPAPVRIEPEVVALVPSEQPNAAPEADLTAATPEVPQVAHAAAAAPAPAAPPAAAPAHAAVEKPKPTPTPAKLTEKLSEKIAKASAPERPHSPSPFALQVAATQSRPDAERLVAKLKGQGHAAYVVEATVPGKGTWYRVRVGGFTTRDAADKYLVGFKQKSQVAAFVAQQ